VRKPYARPLVALLALLALAPGVLLRLASIGFNDLPHGDVLIDALAAESLASHGRFAAPLVLVSSSASGRGAETLLDYRRPLWPLLAAPLVGLSGDGYHATRVLSFISGLAFLWVAYAVFRDLFGRSAAVAALACCTYSYLLVDFSGNGSLYQLQALLFLAFILLVGRVDRTPYAILTGVVVGCAFLLHASGLVLAVAFVLIQVLQWRWGKRTYSRREVLLPLAVAAMIALPWLARNQLLFGSLMPSGSNYLLYKLGVPWTIAVEGGHPRVSFAGSRVSLDHLWAMAQWTVLNGCYSLRQVLVLAPVFAFTAPLGVYLVWKRLLTSRRARNSAQDAALLLVPALFSLLTFVWPVVKFRTFVVLVPLTFGLGVHGALRFLPPFWGRATVAAGFGAVLLSSFLTFAGIESHTYYYDGVLTRDNFGKAGEAEFVAEQSELRRLGDGLARRRKAPILTEQLNLHYYTRFPVVQLVAAMDDAGLGELVRAHGIGYVVTRREQIARYGALFGGRVVAVGERFAAVELPK
jgi:4-amino-4-deoxy-L-arabinose transferase-like glycosyltransferase